MALYHYYGDIVRRLFIVGGMVMVVTYPFFKDRIIAPAIFSVLAIVIVGLAAGLTNPRQQWVMVLDVCISVLGLVFFEYYAITQTATFEELFFWMNQLLAAIFFAAFYYSVKTLRGSFPQ